MLSLPFGTEMTDSLAGKIAIVTGASEGIGARLTAALRARGAHLALVARNEEKLRATAGPEDLVIPCDLTQDATRATVVEQTLARWGKIDILINNAGRGSYYSAITNPLDDARSLFDLNFFAPFHLAQLAAPWLQKSKGTLVNVSSIAGQMSLPWLAMYSASKFALASLTSTQRMELRRHGVNVMAVFPGYVDTDFQANAAGAAPPPAIVKGKRFAVTSAECAEAIVRGIEERRSVVVTPKIGWALVWLNRLFPAIVESQVGKA
jgi:short-subunit dehydrogenase